MPIIVICDDKENKNIFEQFVLKGIYEADIKYQHQKSVIDFKF